MQKQKTSKSLSQERVAKADLSKGKILYDNVLLKAIIVQQDGVVLRPQQYEDKPEWGEVIAVGEGRIFDNGTIIPLKVKPGDIVLFQKYSAQKIRHLGIDYLLVREEDLHFIA